MAKRASRYFLLLIFFPYFLYAQKALDNLKVNTEAGTVVSTSGSTPFLLRANQYGLIPLKSQFAYFNASIKKDYDSTFRLNKKLNRFSWGYGAELQANVGMINQILLPQLYIKGRFRAFQIYAGRRKEIQGLVDTLGTMGSYIWSGNALPLPKVEISIPNYTPLLKNGLLSVKGNFAHGWFGSTDSVKNYYLHQKSLYFRLGKPAWKFKFYAGLNHQVQWGGRPAVPFFDKISNQLISRYGNDFKSYIDVVTGLSMVRGGNSISNQTGVAANEAGNRSGNHLGSVDIGLEFQGNLWKFFIYRQSVYDDGSLFYLNNIADGLNGFSMTKTDGIIRKICFEYLNTSNQGGPYFSGIRSELRGVDNYFNNSIYKDGWTYKGQTIGTPEIVPTSIYLNNHTLDGNSGKNFASNYLINNRVKAFNLSAHYYVGRFKMKTQLISFQNLGNYYYKLQLSQVSFLQALDFKYKNNFYIRTILAADLGQFYKTAVSGRLSIAKSWN